MPENQKWIPYDKEIIQNEDGKIEKIVIKEKIITERSGREKFDQIIKIVGIIAIFIPLLSIFLQNRNNIRKDRHAKLADIYISFNKLKSHLTTGDYVLSEKLIDSVETEYNTKILLYSNKNISCLFNDLIVIKHLILNYLQLNTYSIRSNRIVEYLHHWGEKSDMTGKQTYIKDSLAFVEIINANENYLGNIYEDTSLTSLALLNKINYSNSKLIAHLQKSGNHRFDTLISILHDGQRYTNELTSLTTKQVLGTLKFYWNSTQHFSHDTSILKKPKDLGYPRETVLKLLRKIESEQQTLFDDAVYLELGNYSFFSSFKSSISPPLLQN